MRRVGVRCWWFWKPMPYKEPAPIGGVLLSVRNLAADQYRQRRRTKA